MISPLGDWYYDGLKKGREYTIEKACDWLKGVRLDYYAEHKDEFIEDFCKAMKED